MSFLNIVDFDRHTNGKSHKENQEVYRRGMFAAQFPAHEKGYQQCADELTDAILKQQPIVFFNFIKNQLLKQHQYHATIIQNPFFPEAVPQALTPSNIRRLFPIYKTLPAFFELLAIHCSDKNNYKDIDLSFKTSSIAFPQEFQDEMIKHLDDEDSENDYDYDPDQDDYDEEFN